MGLMNAIGLQPRNPPTSVTSQGTQTLAPQLQNAETQTEREVQEQESTSAGTGEGRSSSNDLSDKAYLVNEEFPHPISAFGHSGYLFSKDFSRPR